LRIAIFADVRWNSAQTFRILSAFGTKMLDRSVSPQTMSPTARESTILKMHMAATNRTPLQRRLKKACAFTKDQISKDDFSAGLPAPMFRIWDPPVGGTRSHRYAFLDMLDWPHIKTRTFVESTFWLTMTCRTSQLSQCDRPEIGITKSRP